MGTNGGTGGPASGAGGPIEGAGRTGTNGGSGGGIGSTCTPLPVLDVPSAGTGGHGAAGLGGVAGSAGTGGQSAATGGQTGRVSFSAPVAYKLGSGPTSVAVADLNGDGKDDFAVTTQGTATTTSGVTVFLNRGDGTFSEPALIVTEGEPVSIAIADVSGDGKHDLAVAVSNVVGNTGAVRVLANNGDGTFAPATSYALPARPSSIKTGDLDGDGRNDLAVAYGDGLALNGLAVLLNQGNGNLAVAKTYSAGEAPAAIALGDLNRDGKLDVVAANYSPEIAGVQDAVHVLLNRGDGTFTAAASYPGGEWLNSVAIADFDGDGLGDVAVANDHATGILLNRGNGVLGSPVTYVVAGGQKSIAVGDLDGDSRPDLATTNPLGFGTAGWSGGRIVVLLNKGDGTFIAPAYFTEAAVVGGIAIGNLNGDGSSDLVVMNGYYDCVYSVSVLLSDAH
jgi:hypothetical protein